MSTLNIHWKDWWWTWSSNALAIQKASSLEKALLLGKTEGRMRREQQDEMVEWHHWLDGHESEQALGVGDGQGSLSYCKSSWGHKESDTIQRLNNKHDLEIADLRFKPQFFHLQVLWTSTTYFTSLNLNLPHVKQTKHQFWDYCNFNMNNVYKLLKNSILYIVSSINSSYIYDYLHKILSVYLYGSHSNNNLKTVALHVNFQRDTVTFWEGPKVKRAEF